MAALENVPSGHAEHASPDTLPVPFGHLVHIVAAPAAAVIPGGHAWHSIISFTKNASGHVPQTPVGVTNSPAAQIGVVQSDAMSLESLRMNVPMGHGWHAARPPSENVLPVQSMHEDAINSEANVPAGQLVHIVAPTPEKVPGPHGVHALAPAAAAIVPGTHVAHTSCPALSAAVPGVHEVHATCPAMG